MKTLKTLVLSLFLITALAALALSAAAWYWTEQPVALSAERIDYVVEAGSRPRTIAQLMNKSGISINEDAFVILAQLSGNDKTLQAGAYEAVRGVTPRTLTDRLATGTAEKRRVGKEGGRKGQAQGWT